MPGLGPGLGGFGGPLGPVSPLSQLSAVMLISRMSVLILDVLVSGLQASQVRVETMVFPPQLDMDHRVPLVQSADLWVTLMILA
jgi:hypothetical protein